MLYKKRWSDGLNQDFDHLNEFEAKFYCFGGDGGGDSGGGGGKSPSKQNKKAAAQEPKRGRPAPPTKQETLNIVNRAAQDSLEAKRGLQDFSAPPPNAQNAPSLGDLFGARVPDSLANVTPQQNVSTLTPASFTTELPSVTSLPSMADMINMAPAANVNTYSPPTQQNVNPLSVDLGPGTLTPTFDPANQGVGLNFSMPFNPSSVNQQGIGSLDQNRVMDALTSGVNNPQATTAPTTDVAFLDTVQNVFGTLPGQTTYKGNLARRGNTYTSASTGGRSSTQKQKNFLDQIAGTGKTMASQVGLGSLFD